MANNIIIPSDPKTKQKIKNAVKEISNSFTRIQSENENVAAILARMKEECEIPSPILRKLARTFYNQNMQDQLSEFEDFEALYDVILQENQS